MSSYDAGPIRDPAAARVCTLAGLNQAYKGLATLRQLDRGMEIALQEVSAAQTRAELIDTALVVARFTKATCDAFIGLAAELSGNKAAGKIGDAYGASGVAADLVGKITAGARVDKAALAADALKAGSAYMGTNAGYLAKNLAVKGELIRSAMNADEKAVLKSAGEYGADLATYTLDHLKEIEKGTKTGTASGLTSKFIKIGKEIFTYNEKLGEAFDAYLEDKETTRASFISQKQTIRATA